MDAATQQAQNAIAAERRRMAETGNTAASARYFSRHRDDVLKRRIEYRIASGSIPTSVSMTRYGITIDAVNAIRRTSGLSPLKADVYPFRLTEEDMSPSLNAEVSRRMADETKMRELRDAKQRAETIVRQRQQAQVATSEAADILATNSDLVNSDGSFKTSIEDVRSYFLTPDPRTGKLPIIRDPAGNDLKKGTRKLTLKLTFSTLTSAMNCDTSHDIVDCIKNFDKVEKYFKEQYELHKEADKDGEKAGYAASTILTALQRLFAVNFYYLLNFTRGTDQPPLIPDAIVEKYNKLSRYYQGLAQARQAEQRDKDNVSDFKTIMDMVLKEFPKTSEDYPWENLLIRLYNWLTIRDDYGGLKIVNSKDKFTSDEDEAFIYVPTRSTGKASIRINDHKTVKKYGPIKHELDAALTKEVKFYMKENGLTYGDFLFHKKKNKKKPAGSMSAKVGKMLKAAGVKDIPGVDNKGSINLFRHSKISSVGADATPEEKAKLAEEMNHLPTTQLTYVRNTVQAEK